MAKLRKYKTLRGLFNDAKRWTQDYFALDSGGESVEPISTDAVCFCLIGGVRRVYGRGKKAGRILEKIERYLLENYGTTYVYLWNDNTRRKHKDIINLTRALKI